jgi:hypothetical protein
MTTGDISTPNPVSPSSTPAWLPITDYDAQNAWGGETRGRERSRWCCEQLEAGEILFFDAIPYDFPQTDRDFLLQQRQGNSRIHKNISFRPKQDLMRGGATGSKEDDARLHQIMRHFSGEITRLLTRVLAPYAPHWSLDYASYRPLEEQGRDLPLTKRNDLLHVDAFPTRPTHGGRILRCFTNINPLRSRNWLTTHRFPQLAEKYARAAGLDQIARNGHSGPANFLTLLQRALGLKAADRSAYDKFMLRFHDYLKQNNDFQQNCPKIRLEFPPMATWMCYTDSVPHAVLSGQYALEQTFIIPVRALLTPEKSPIRLLEKMAGRPLAGHASCCAPNGKLTQNLESARGNVM